MVVKISYLTTFFFKYIFFVFQGEGQKKVKIKRQGQRKKVGLVWKRCKWIIALFSLLVSIKNLIIFLFLHEIVQSGYSLEAL